MIDFKNVTTLEDTELCIDYRFRIRNIEVHTKPNDDLYGYIDFSLQDGKCCYEGLYRIYDPENGNAYTLVSIDYLWWDYGTGTEEVVQAVQTKLTEALKPFISLSA